VPGDKEILIRVRATTITAGEIEMRQIAFRNVLAVLLRLYFGLFPPRGQRVLGQELAGDLVDVGRDVTRFLAERTSTSSLLW
jgi:NADPH:quinone reductase-like Zn-dependent oxidoreductase